MNFYISDLHLGHDKALIFDGRPFSSIEEQNLMMIRRWNKVVTQYDTVFILGDFSMYDQDGMLFLNNTKGRKVLIAGNHDKSANILMKFDEVHDYLEIKDGGTDVILSHYPIAHWNKSDYGSIQLYGHIHRSRDSIDFEHYVYSMRNRTDETTGRRLPYNAYNVGCMMPYIDYTPRTISEIIRGDKKYYAEQFRY